MQFDFLKDARYFQIIFQCMFLSYGVFYLHWNTDWWLYSTYFVICVVTQFLSEVAFNKTGFNIFSPGWWAKLKMGLPSALISFLGLSLLLKTNHYEIAALAALFPSFQNISSV